MERPAWVAEALQRLRTYEQAAYKLRFNAVRTSEAHRRFT